MTVMDALDLDLGDRIAAGLAEEDSQYIDDPVGWVEERTGEFVWSKQRETLESVRDNPFTSVRSAHSTGKSHIASRAIAWWVDAHPPEETFVVTTAPSANQVRGILWRYVKSVHQKASLPGYITGGDVPEWKLPGDMLIGWGRKPSDLLNAEQAATVFQGIHARYLLVVADEAGGIPHWLWTAITTLVSDEGATGRVLAIGNPDDPTSHFASINAPGSKWNQIQIKAFDSPNYIDRPEYTGTEEMEAIDRECPPEVKSVLVGPRFVDNAKDEWGEDSPLYVAKVDAEFPLTSDDTLIQIRWIREAMERDLSGTAITTQGQYALDVARTGRDEAVLGHIRGGMFRIEKAKAGIDDTMRLVGWLSNAHDESPAAPMIVDADGMGGPVYDRAAELNLPVAPFYAGRRAFQPKKFKNRRSEQWWQLREWFREGFLDIDPKDNKLQSQLASIKFAEDSAGRIKVETKDDMKKRGLPSPDRGDVLMMISWESPDWIEGVEPADRGETMTGDLLTAEM